MNFTLVDTLAVLKACAVLTPVMFAPGYVVGWALNLFQFRRRRLILRVVLAVPLSIALSPIISYLLARCAQSGLWLFYLAATAAALPLLTRDLRQTRMEFSRYTRIALGVCAVWILGAIALLADLQIADRLYPPLCAYDHATRVAIMGSVAQHIPPSNPFFAHAVAPLRYHYLWMLLCSVPLKFLHIAPRILMYAGVVWCGLGLMCAIALGFKFLLREQTAIAQKTLIGVALLSVTGLDILPTIHFAGAGGSWLADMEWWNDPQINSWAASLLWAPHHVAALIACFVGFILLRHEAGASARRSLVSAIIAGVAFASAVGMSVYVTFTFAAAVGLWLLALVARKHWKEATLFVGAGIVAAICAFPYLFGLKAPAGAAGTGAALVELALRPFPLGVYFAQQIGAAIRTQAGVTAANAMLLPVNYALELGFFLGIGIMRLRQVLQGKVIAGGNELAAWTLVMAGFAIGTFLRSSAITTNDLGFRCFLPAQLVLLLWARSLVHEWWFGTAAPEAAPRPWVRRVLVTLVVVGLLGSAYEVFMIRMAPVLAGSLRIAGIGWSTDREAGKRIYAVRSAYEALDAQLPASAIVQHNPATPNSIPHALYAGRSAVAGGMDCVIAFGGDKAVCDERVRRLLALFQFSRGNLEMACREYGIDLMVAEDTDPAWHQPSSWVWTERPAVANDYIRAFRCNTATAHIHP